MDRIATIGFFDGVHRGHRFLLSQVTDLAEARKGVSVAVTFSNSPRSVVDKSFKPSFLTTAEEKRQLLLDYGINEVCMKKFTQETMCLTAQEFMQKVLHDELEITTLVIGYDHRFGHNRSDGFDDYVRYGSQLGIEVIKAEAYEESHVPVSSSIIRQAIAEGSIRSANNLLGRPYSIEGLVIDGFHVGRTIGYPTANLDLPAEKLVPADGVYAVLTEIDGRQYTGMLNIGCRPTFDNGRRSIEVHFLDFNEDIYSERINLRFIERIRSEKRFASVEELTAQIRNDENTIRSIITNNQHT